ncbi:UNVERIFIED_CONTAM: hypothetical protein PYX00_002952 [Menopon gallinae]|uniref:RUN and FYVE domain-containing protein 2 n=1 Tax=Menopon gallinae TaxID=328185 RepID=A0AAW2HYI7_9NEOP
MAASYESVTNENVEKSDVSVNVNAESPQGAQPPEKEEHWPDLMVTRAYKSARKLPKAAKDPVLIERSNLVNISKLVVKELIETSQKYGRMLDSDHLPLQHFFIVLEHVLRHGLKPKKGLLGPKKELWDILQLVEKFTPEAQDMTTSVRDLPTVKTHMGRARAWLRLALMQKKLADYLKVLIDRKEDVLCEYFEPDALMMSDEAFIIIGLLLGLNVIDCNLCVKEEDLDCQQGVIDFSLYLRSSHHYYQSADSVLDPDNMTTVLDQKNYIEELNRHLNATVTNLEAKVESLETTNALMKEDLEISKNNYLLLSDENSELKRQLGLSGRASDKADEGGGGDASDGSSAKKDGDKKSGEVSSEVEELRKQLEMEKAKRMEVEKELKLQVNMKTEMEVAMKLLEKDIHEKQNTIISLRKQLEEIKLINLEMFKKLQDCESSLKQKTELVKKLEEKSVSIAETFRELDAKYQKAERERMLYEKSSQKLHTELEQKEAMVQNAERDLTLEREWRNSLQSSMEGDRDKIFQLNQELSALRETAKKYDALKEESEQLRKVCQEQELTLEELGVQLSVSRLKVVDLQEEARAKTESQWASDKDAMSCKDCGKEFSLTRRKHHCRNCGDIFCNPCSDNTFMMPFSSRPVRICNSCHAYLVGKNSLL